MTWCKLGTEFFDQLVDADFPAALDDACQLTHTQALHFLYSVEAMDLTFKKTTLRRFATSTQAEAAAEALVCAGAWQDLGREYRVVHHQDVFRQSLGYQIRERERAKNAMSKRRHRALEVTQDVTRNELRTQTDSQTGRSSEHATSTTASIPPAVPPAPTAPSPRTTTLRRNVGEQAS